MAYDNDESFHGHRYLLDSKNSREYAMRFDNGRPAKITPYAVDEREAGFKPNEVAFAFDDEAELKRGPNGHFRLETIIWQLGANEEGLVKKLKYSPVEFDVSFSRDKDGDFRVNYVMIGESQETLREKGFEEGFPVAYSDIVDPSSVRSGPNGTAVIDPRVLDVMSFPPHHPGKQADIARFNVESASSLPNVPAEPDTRTAPQPRPEDSTSAKPVTSKPANDFNRTASTFTPPKAPEKPRISDSALDSVIRQYCKDLTAKAEAGKGGKILGRDKETDQALRVLSRLEKASLCFTGDAGVGKSAMFDGVAQRITEGVNVPESLRGARVLQLDLQAMNAGAKFRGEFEAKLKPLIDGLQEREGWFRGRKIILAIDEIHSQLTAGKAEGGTDAGNMMKPFLTSEGICVMGTTTSDEYRKHIEKDKALKRRFEQMVLDQPSTEVTKHILAESVWPRMKAHHNIAEDLSDDDFDYIIAMSNRYAPDSAQPDKSKNVIDSAGASAQFRGSRVIEREDILVALSQMSGLKPEFLGQSDSDRFLKMEEELPKNILGQPGIKHVVDSLIGARSGLNDPSQPWGVFVLQGPTGTGKTEFCKQLALYLFGDENAMTKLDMSEYSEKHTVSRLIGAPPGYVGFEDATPALLEPVRRRPFQIVLLDEIEKAHPDVFNVLLPIFNDGRSKDNHERTVLFNNVIFVMTTNLGAKEAMSFIEGRSGMSFGGKSDIEDPAKMEEGLSRIYGKARGSFFRPEMQNRIDELGGFVTWVPLTKGTIEELLAREVAKVGKRMSDSAGAGVKNVSLEVSDEVKAQLSKDGYNPAMGARPMRKVVREKIANPLGKWLLANKESLAKFAAENGGAKIVIEQIGANFSPKLAALEERQPAAAATNDNAKKKPRKRAAGPA